MPLWKRSQTCQILVARPDNVIIKPSDTALFTVAVTALNRGFLAIGDWLKAHQKELVELFHTPKGRIPSYSTLRRILLELDYQTYSACLAKFFGIEPALRRNDCHGWQSPSWLL